MDDLFWIIYDAYEEHKSKKYHYIKVCLITYVFVLDPIK